MNITEETKSAAARFITEHETMQEELANARLRIEDQRKELDRLDATLSMQKEALAAANTDKNTYLQYAFELSAQLQFIVGGSARALMIAANVRNKIAAQAANIPPVAGADIAELEGILERIGESNAAANDGNGMTGVSVTVAGTTITETVRGVPPSPGPMLLTEKQIAQACPEPPPLPGFLVDREGKPMTVQPSAASIAMQAPMVA